MDNNATYSNEQENQIAAVYEAVGNLIAVMVPDCKHPRDIHLVGPIADMVSEHLQERGKIVSFPVRVTAHDGETYILNTQAQCKNCCHALDDFADEQCDFTINSGHSDEFRVCFACHRDLMENGVYTQCESCGNYFTPDYLRVNPVNGVREHCPYCDEVWCE